LHLALHPAAMTGLDLFRDMRKPQLQAWQSRRGVAQPTRLYDATGNL